MTLIVSVFCAATAIAASAQTFTTLATFDNIDGQIPATSSKRPTGISTGSRTMVELPPVVP
jgi:hypothetical protein